MAGSRSSSLLVVVSLVAGGAVAACGSSSVTSSSSSGGGSGGASTSSSGGGSGGTSTTSSGGGAGGVTTGTGGTTMGMGGGNGCDCAAGQLCVVPACREVLGEECYSGTPDEGEWSCPPGTDRGAQFDSDCVQPGFACVTGCPPDPPSCLDLPAGCGGVATCACLLDNPCHPSNSGACLDADIVGDVLSCSLMP